MAQLIPLRQAIEARQRVLFDTNVLIDLFNREATRGPLTDLLELIPLNLRSTVELTLWEFLRSHAGVHGKVRDRVQWLRRKGIAVIYDRPTGFNDSFSTLVERQEAKGSAVDGTLAVWSVAAGGRVAIATDNTSDFCWHAGIQLVAEFAVWRNPGTPPPC